MLLLETIEIYQEIRGRELQQMSLAGLTLGHPVNIFNINILSNVLTYQQ